MAGWPVIFFLSAALAADPEPGDVAASHAGSETVEVTASGDGSATRTDVALGAEAAGRTDLAGVLEGVPGASVRRLGGLGDFAAVRLRGSTFQQVEVFLDGVPLNPDGDSVIDLATLPVSTFAQMRVYRGFSPASYGSAAMGGMSRS